MRPTIGRIVNYHYSDGAVYPAIIHCVHNDTCVSLNVFCFDDVLVKTSVMEGTEVLQWSWPERSDIQKLQ